MWNRRLRQGVAIARAEIGKHALGLRAMPLYLFAMLPVGACALVVAISLVFEAPSWLASTAGITEHFASLVFQLILRLVIYFGCVWISIMIVRGEMFDRSLHYYFLAPVRRELLVAGKFVAAWLISGVAFSVTTIASNAVLYGFHGLDTAIDQTIGAGLGRTLGYLGVTWLACFGYSALIVALSVFLRNPTIPALLVFLWEQVNPFLPALLKKFSIVFYLQSLLPVPISFGPFSLIAEPTPAILAVPGLFLFAGLVLGAAGWRIRRTEIAYGSD